jgi:hypothetical protein
VVAVLKSRFEGAGREGDFSWMILQPQYDRTLFVFNDNEEQFYAHFNGTEHCCSAGGGNAAIRPWQCGDEPRATGVPTGCYQPGPHQLGYSALDSHVRRAIADALAQIVRLLRTGRFDTLAFSWDDRTHLGGRIFDTAQDVRDHIVAELLAVAANN